MDSDPGSVLVEGPVEYFTPNESAVWVDFMRKHYEPRCGHPNCDYRAMTPLVLNRLTPHGHVVFWCEDHGHWTGYEHEVRWVPKGPAIGIPADVEEPQS